MFFFKTSVAVWGLATTINAHMKMGTPKPFAVPAVVNSPLSPDGSNFPCQITAGMTASAGGVSNVFALGSTQPLTFIGQATHGGGSCQISLTYDVSPTKNSVWKVIHSIEGGCPAKNTPGNMGDDASAADPFTYSFPVPENIPTGNATLAWSWLNKIGNREYYMNCAPVTLTGTSGAKANYDALPDMLVANLNGINQCTTTEGVDYKYPSPGDSVDIFASDLSYPNGACGPTASGGSASGAPSSAADPPAGSATQASGSTSTSPPASGGVFVTVPTGGASSQAADPPASTQATTEATAAASTPTTAASAAAPTATASSGSGSSGSSGSGGSGTAGAKTAGTACSPEGQWLCLGTSYQQCGSGVWTPVMPLAAGTSCSSGEGSTINIVASGSKAKRLARRFRG